MTRKPVPLKLFLLVYLGDNVQSSLGHETADVADDEGLTFPKAVGSGAPSKETEVASVLCEEIVATGIVGADDGVVSLLVLPSCNKSSVQFYVIPFRPQFFFFKLFSKNCTLLVFFGTAALLNERMTLPVELPYPLFLCCCQEGQ